MSAKQRDVWLSVAGGVATAYVFLRLLPKLGKAQPVLTEMSDRGMGGFLHHHAYLVSLAGFVVYFGLDGQGYSTTVDYLGDFVKTIPEPADPEDIVSAIAVDEVLLLQSDTSYAIVT